MKVLAMFLCVLATFRLVQLSHEVAPPTDPMQGFLFDYQLTVLLAKSSLTFILVLPFPFFDNSILQYITDIRVNIYDLWKYPNYRCNLKQSNTTKLISSNPWIYKKPTWSTFVHMMTCAAPSWSSVNCSQ